MTREEHMQIGFYKFIQPLFSTITTAGVIGLVTVVFQLNSKVAVLQSEVVELRTQVRVSSDIMVKQSTFDMRSSYVERSLQELRIRLQSLEERN
ncbi:MAG: hypothetical protein EP346_08685 [Bacteroidetes bacterium]|nr:MAG: hypothetical protein EP346_08685 [Bacteroidota bacterium]